MTDLAADTEKVMSENYASLSPDAQGVEPEQQKDHWWKFW